MAATLHGQIDGAQLAASNCASKGVGCKIPTALPHNISALTRLTQSRFLLDFIQTYTHSKWKITENYTSVE